MQTYSTLSPSAPPHSHTLLAQACHQYWGMETIPPLFKEQWGKPTFQLDGFHFNLSHSGDAAICCLANQPVGVDIQRPRYSRPQFLDRLCSPQERQWLKDFQDSQEAFALLWAVKESLCKYTGRGITFPLSQLVVPLPADLPATEEWTAHKLQDLTFSICHLHGCMVSVCGTEAVSQPNILLD